MGLIDFLKKILGRSDAAALQSASINSRSDAAAMQNASVPDFNPSPELSNFAPAEEPELFYRPLPKSIPAEQSPPQPQTRVAEPTYTTQRPAFPPQRQQAAMPQMPVFVKPVERQPTIELQKDSLELGMAAGYAGRSLKEIESSMVRIESLMASKEWFSSQFEPQLRAIYDSIRIHDENTSKKLEMIEFLIQSLEKTARKAPEPLRTSLMQQIDAMKAELPLSPKMQELVDIVEQSGKISYDDLYTKLGVQRSSLRGLLTNTMKRTSRIERVVENNRSMVRTKAMQLG